MQSDLTVSEVATRLKVTNQTVTNWLSRGDLDGYRLGKSEVAEWRITRKAIAEFLGVELDDLRLE